MRWIIFLLCIGLCVIPAFAQDEDLSACEIDVQGITSLLEEAQATIDSDRPATMTALKAVRAEIQALILACDDNPSKTASLSIDNTTMQVAYPQDWLIKADDNTAFFITNTADVIDRELFGQDPPAMNSGEVLVYITLTPPDIFPTDSDDMLARLNAVVETLADTFSEATEPTLIEHDLYEIGQVRFFMPTVWASIIAVDLKQDDLLAVLIVLSAPSELRSWDETITSILDSITIVESDSNANE